MPYNDEFCFSGTCDLCGEGFDTTSRQPSKNEVGEFYLLPDHEPIEKPMEDGRWMPGDHVIAHAQCGIDADLALA